MGKKDVASAGKVFTMRPELMRQANFKTLLKQTQIGPNGHSKEWLALAQSDELIEVLEKKGSGEYFKELKEKLAAKGFYREFLD